LTPLTIAAYFLSRYDTTLVDACTALKDRWLSWKPSSEPSPFTKADLDKFPMKSYQVEEFLAEILDSEGPFEVEKAKAMEAAYEFNSIKNCEIRFR
jgi:hypothetical protein